MKKIVKISEKGDVMKEIYHLAIDIGASSGRHILAHIKNGEIKMEEIYRFPNQMKVKDGHKVWDVDYLFSQIIEGMKRCDAVGKRPVSVGVDTWAVDYVLLDENGERIGNTYSYRDGRTNGIQDYVYGIVTENALYKRTGIQKAQFNTVFQLVAQMKQEPDVFDKADTMLMLPDYFNYLLTGEKFQEYTNATSTGLVNPQRCSWDSQLIEALGIPRHIFLPIAKPGLIVGRMKEDIAALVGYNCAVVLTASHDTASAVMSIPSQDEDVAFISSGTWSLMGCERGEADCSDQAEKSNFTNEGGYNYRYRFLKNIMGLWMIQCVRNELRERGKEYSFEELCRLAEKTENDIYINVNDKRFLAPDSMIDEIRQAVMEQGVDIPQTVGEISKIIYCSLAKCYGNTMRELESITGKKFKALHIVGGGSKSDYLNRLTAKEVGIPVYAGPDEATALGNVGAQMMACKECESLIEFRKMLELSCEIKSYSSSDR